MKIIMFVRTSLLSHNWETEFAKNYRPIACLNLVCKFYVSGLNLFLSDHCQHYSIETKNPGWFNKWLKSKKRNKKRNLMTMRLDYKKAFASVPHDWLIKSLHHLKLPEGLIRAFKHLISLWNTVTLVRVKRNNRVR